IGSQHRQKSFIIGLSKQQRPTSSGLVREGEVILAESFVPLVNHVTIELMSVVSSGQVAAGFDHGVVRLETLKHQTATSQFRYRWSGAFGGRRGFWNKEKYVSENSISKQTQL